MLNMALTALVSLLAMPALYAAAPLSASTSLVVQVEPEARIDPQQVALHVRVSAEGAVEVLTHPAAITAWVRTLPGQQIRVTARLSNFRGPSGPLAGNIVRWSGAVSNATAGAQQALCSSGIFVPGASGDLVHGWQQSGKLTCRVSFDLAAPLPPGEYTGLVDFALGRP